MNKDVIKKYWKEFEHWVHGGEVLIRFKSHDTIPVYDYRKAHKHTRWDNRWHTEGCEITYIINDEYVEFRKALAEGKTIEYLNANGDWVIKGSMIFQYPSTAYRIKPEEPKFKVGDYVVVTKNDGTKIINQFKREDTDGEHYKIVFTKIIDHGLNFIYNKHIHTLKLWTLEEADDGEWVLVQYEDVLREQVKDVSKEQMDWCVPYIGQTPAQLGLEK